MLLENFILESSPTDKTILLIEDCSDDVVFMEQACRRSGVPHDLKFVMDGEAAVDYLAGSIKLAHRVHHPVPSLVFLDAKLPGMSGHEVLEWIREQPRFKNLPVIMLTGSSLDIDLERAYQLGVTSYMQKNCSQHEFEQTVRIVLQYWLQLNAPPMLSPAQQIVQPIPVM